MPDRFCQSPSCGALLMRNVNESASNFSMRLTCNAACAKVYRASKGFEPGERLCAFSQCQKPLIRRDREGPRDFARRKTCGHDCGIAYQREQLAGGVAAPPRQHKSGKKKPCALCADQSWRRPKSGCPKCGGEYREESAA